MLFCSPRRFRRREGYFIALDGGNLSCRTVGFCTDALLARGMSSKLGFTLTDFSDLFCNASV